MASPSLDTSHFNDVVPACRSVRARWRDLGTRLGVSVQTLDSIETTHNGDVERCMPAMIEKWLQRPLGEVRDGVIPTWRSLCVALSHIDRPLADRLAEEHNCGDINMSVEDADLSRTEAKPSVARTDNKRVAQTFQKVAPVEFLKEMSSKPMKTITGVNYPRGVAVRDNGDIVVAKYGAHCVTIVKKEGEIVKSFGTRGTKEGQFTYPRGVAISNDRHILVTDSHRLQKLTFDGTCLQSVGSSESGSDRLQFNHPRGITVHPTTLVTYVADSENNRIQVFFDDLTFSHSITLCGDKQFCYPSDVALDSKGCLYVAEFGNHCITKLTETGQYITRFGSKGSAPGQLYQPSSLTINNNLVYISEYGNDDYITRVSVFDTNGTFLHCFGKSGSGEGEFRYPRGITTDTFGNLFVSDTHNNRIVVFSLLCSW